MSEPIRFYKGEETGIVHENYHDISTSLFKDQYLKALNEIGAYLQKVDGWERKNSEDGRKYEFDLNNIFAFVGERGTGKTSCMESVADMIKELSDDWHKQGNIVKTLIRGSKYSAIECKTFQILETIDPTTLDVKTNILEVVIGKLFKSFQAYVKTIGKPCDDDKKDSKRRAVIDSFQNIKNCLKYLISRDLFSTGQDSIVQVSDLAMVSELQLLFRNLVKAYLKYVEKDVLVLQIDDIDLQTNYAYQMVEQIRKYFIQENVVILIAVKIEQLSEVIELENTKKFEPLLQTHRMSKDDIADMSARYISKLIPISQRIYLPVSNVYFEQELEIYTSRKEEKLLGKEALIDNWTSVKYAITSLIYIKCRFLFYHSKGIVSPIVPNNLRELRHLMDLLMQMRDYHDKSDDVSFRLMNKNKFLNYFYSTWVNGNISTEDYKIVDSIIRNRNVASLNKEVIQLLKSKYQDTIFQDYTESELRNASAAEKVANDDVLFKILNVKNASYNISIADVFVVLEYIKLRTYSRYDKMLIFFIESYYSIKMYEYYDVITAKYHPQTYIKTTQDRKIDDSIRKREIIEDFSNYEVLVGGSFINTAYHQLTPAEQYTGKSRDNRMINFRELKKVARECINPITQDDGVNYETLKFVEFFALCINRVVERKSNKNYREQNELYYKFNSERMNKYAQFDLGAFFFNIVNIKRAYSFVHKDLFAVASKEGVDSLYNGLLKAGEKDRGKMRGYEDNLHSLLSCVSIRNFEVLTDFVSQVEYNAVKWKNTISNRANIAQFFQNVEEYNIKTYDKEGSEPLAISFRYSKVIKELLQYKLSEETPTQIYRKESDKYGKFDKLFDSIFVVEDDGRDWEPDDSFPKDDLLEVRPLNVNELMTKFPGNKYKVNGIDRIVKSYIKGRRGNNAPELSAWRIFVKKFDQIGWIGKTEIRQKLTEFIRKNSSY